MNKEIIKIAHSNSRVFISGIVGAGKKLISQLIHQNSIYSNLLCFIVDFKNITENELAEMFSEDEININQNILVQANNNTLILESSAPFPSPNRVVIHSDPVSTLERRIHMER